MPFMLWPWPWFNLYPTPSGCIVPHADAILICFELPPLLPPRWFPSLRSPCYYADDLAFSWTPEPPSATPVEVCAGDPFVSPVQASGVFFHEYVIHTALSSSDSNLFICYSVFQEMPKMFLCHTWWAEFSLFVSVVVRGHTCCFNLLDFFSNSHFGLLSWRCMGVSLSSKTHFGWPWHQHYYGPSWLQVEQVMEPLQVLLLWSNFWHLKQRMVWRPRHGLWFCMHVL